RDFASCGTVGAATPLTPHGATTGNRPTFTYTAATGADSYILAQIKTVDILTNNPNPTVQILGTSTTNSFTPSTDIPNGDYFWVAVPVNSACGTSGPVTSGILYTLNATCPL